MNKVTVSGWINIGHTYSEAQDITDGQIYGAFRVYSDQDHAEKMSNEKYAPVMAAVTIEFEETGEIRKDAHQGRDSGNDV